MKHNCRVHLVQKLSGFIRLKFREIKRSKVSNSTWPSSVQHTFFLSTRVHLHAEFHLFSVCFFGLLEIIVIKMNQKKRTATVKTVWMLHVWIYLESPALSFSAHYKMTHFITTIRKSNSSVLYIKQKKMLAFPLNKSSSVNMNFLQK